MHFRSRQPTTYAFLQKHLQPHIRIVTEDQNASEQTITDTAIPDAVPVTEGLFTSGPHPCLIGGRERETGRIVFPCPVGYARFDPVELPRCGTLWSWTVQHFRPKTPPYFGPEAFEPFALGSVELPDAVIIEARLTGVAFDAIRIGMDMQTVLIPFATDAQGRALISCAFAPMQKDSAHG